MKKQEKIEIRESALNEILACLWKNGTVIEPAKKGQRKYESDFGMINIGKKLVVKINV